jgi:hypothetical protein
LRSGEVEPRCAEQGVLLRCREEAVQRHPGRILQTGDDGADPGLIRSPTDDVDVEARPSGAELVRQAHDVVEPLVPDQTPDRDDAGADAPRRQQAAGIRRLTDAVGDEHDRSAPAKPGPQRGDG